MIRAADFDSISVGLPPEWATLPLEQQTFDRFVTDLRTRWRDEPSFDRTTERRAELLLNRVRGELRRLNVRYAAMYLESPPDGAVGDDAETLMAACTLATYTQADLDTTLPLTHANLLAAFVVKRKGGAGGATRDADRRMVDIEPPTKHDLRIGRAIRLRRLYEMRQSIATETQRLYIETFVVPVGEDATTCGVLQFVTPNLPMARAFSSLFVAIAETVVLLTPDQETEIAAIRP
jgi:hypothetical protein